MSSNADGSIPSYLYDLDNEEAAELFGACTPQVTDKEGSVRKMSLISALDILMKSCRF